MGSRGSRSGMLLPALASRSFLPTTAHMCSVLYSCPPCTLDYQDAPVHRASSIELLLVSRHFPSMDHASAPGTHTYAHTRTSFEPHVPRLPSYTLTRYLSPSSPRCPPPPRLSPTKPVPPHADTHARGTASGTGPVRWAAVGLVSSSPVHLPPRRQHRLLLHVLAACRCLSSDERVARSLYKADLLPSVSRVPLALASSAITQRHSYLFILSLSLSLSSRPSLSIFTSHPNPASPDSLLLLSSYRRARPSRI